MNRLDDVEISKIILNAYHESLLDRIASDVLIVGAGPAGLTAAIFLTREGFRVTVFEKRLAPGGGIWGGGAGMSRAVVQEDALPLLDKLGIEYESRAPNYYSLDTVELAAGLCLNAAQSGAAVFNLMTVEDVAVRGRAVTGLVVNRTGIAENLPVDPITFSAKAVIDTTGHEANVVAALRRRGLLDPGDGLRRLVEGPMDAAAGETFVVENTGELFPGLWLAGMSVCATLGGPRMGPIFGGMLLSGKRAADSIAAKIPLYAPAEVEESTWRV